MEDNGVYSSSDSGATWQPANIGIDSAGVWSLIADSSFFFAGDNNNEGLFRSSDRGRTWSKIHDGGIGANDLAIQYGYFFASLGNGLFISRDEGDTWREIGQGLPENTGGPAFVFGPYLFAATTAGVWRRPLSEIIGTNEVAKKPATKSEIQSYPNPFSASTTITFTPKAMGYADISIVNLLGVEVAHLFSGELDAGEHSFEWDAARMAAPRGVYECLVRMNGQIEKLPVVLLR